MALDIKCSVCGKEPGYECRWHFVRDMNKLKEENALLAGAYDNLEMKYQAERLSVAQQDEEIARLRAELKTMTCMWKGLRDVLPPRIAQLEAALERIEKNGDLGYGKSCPNCVVEGVLQRLDKDMKTVLLSNDGGPMANQIAPEGQVYVCGACGKRSRDRYGDKALQRGWDESCMMNSILCVESSLKFDETGTRVVGCEAVVSEVQYRLSVDHP